MSRMAMHSLVAVTFVASAALCSAQEAPSSQAQRGTIVGEVVDAATLRPLSGATVILRPAGGGALPPTRSGTAFFTEARSVVTGASGEYRFDDLPDGSYQLRVQRIGYRPVTIDVQLIARTDARVSVGLAVAPIRLHPLQVQADPPPTYARSETGTDREAEARVGAARARQREFLASDTREVTHADVVESVTLAETDLFRAVQRLPGVAAADEYSAELWIRGSRWDQTRVYFDGLPLFNPLHAFGVLSGIGPDMIGAAFIHPGVRPASVGEGGAAVLDLRSRPGGGNGRVRGLGELSLLSSRFSLDQRRRDGRTAWMVAGRRSYIDLLSGYIARSQNEPTSRLPYHFSELSGRVDQQIGRDKTIEASAFLERDYVKGDLPDLNHGNHARWGNVATRVSLLAPLGRFESRHSIGVSQFGARISEAPIDPDIAAHYGASTERPMRTSLLYATVGGTIKPASADSPHWSLGYDLIAQRLDLRAPRERIFAADISRGEYVENGSLTYVSLWGDRRWRPATRLTLETGLRVDAGAAIEGAGAVRAAPSLQARFAVDSQMTVSAGVGRSFQYTQAFLQTAHGMHGRFYPTPIWVLAGGDTPAVRTDLVTLGAERWLGGGALFSVGGYVRAAANVVMADPRPGILLDRPLYVVGTERARGIEVSLRRLTGRLTGSLGYSYGSAEMHAAGLSFPSPTMRRHSFDATALLRLTRSFYVGAGYTAASGHRYTRVDRGGWTEDSLGQRSWVQVPSADEPSGRETGPYRSLDLMLDYSFMVRGWRVATFLQVRNARNRYNPAFYSGSNTCSSVRYNPETRSDECVGTEDEFVPGLPRLPVIGFRVSF
jgi:hypothetical protein